MSTPARPSGAIRWFVPGYLVFIGLVLLLWSVYLGEEPFVAGMAVLGGLTMIGSAVAMFTIAERGAR